MSKIEIIFTSHAELKFEIFKSHNFLIEKETIIDAINNPDKMEESKAGRIVIQKLIDVKHVLRIVCEKKGKVVKVITFYPGRRERYEG